MAAAAETLRTEQVHIDYEQRRYYDTVTWLAEVLPGAMRTPFEYGFNGRELYASDGSPLEAIFDDSITQTESTYGRDSFEYRRVSIEKQEYHDMISMMRGDLPNTMVVVSDFPPELMNAKNDVGGYNIGRKQTMLRVLTKTPEGTLKMYSQSLDMSNRAGLEALYTHLGFMPEPGELLGQRMHIDFDQTEQDFLIDELTGVYDRTLEQKYSGTWYAGRKGEKPINTYDFVCQQQDLLKAYLLTTPRFTGGSKDYNLAAAMEARYQSNGIRLTIPELSGRPAIAAHVLAVMEMQQAGSRAQLDGKVFSGCGLTASAFEQRVLGSLSEQQLLEAGYSKGLDTVQRDKFGPLNFTCPKGHWNKRKPAKSPKDFMPNCTKCGTSLMCKKKR